MRRKLALMIIPLACIACTQPVPEEQLPDQTVARMLYQIALPGEWQHTAESNGYITFALPSVYAQVNYDPYLDHDYFGVHYLAPQECSKNYASEREKENWGELRDKYLPTEIILPDKKVVGYSWLAFDGVVGTEESQSPGMRHWCVHRDEQWMDIDITAIDKDVNTKTFVETEFIPRWMKMEAK